MEKSTVPLKITRPGRHSTTPLSARSSYDNENRARNGVRKYMQFSDLWYFRTLHLESYSSKKQAFRNTKLGTRSAMGLYYHPLPVIYTFGASASDYTCRPIMPVVRIYITLPIQLPNASELIKDKLWSYRFGSCRLSTDDHWLFEFKQNCYQLPKYLTCGDCCLWH